MEYIKTKINEFINEYTLDEKLCVLLFASLFMPWVISGAVIIVNAFYILWKKEGFKLIKEVWGGKLLFAFCIYLFIVSLFNGNIYGALISIGLLLMVIDLLHYRKHITLSVFQFTIEVVIVLSLVSVIYAIFEQLYYMSLFEGMGFFDIKNSPDYRVHTYFLNSNYYVLLLLYIECMCIYKLSTVKEKPAQVYYVAVMLMNLLALYLTGGRAGWPAFAVSVVVMFFVNKYYRLLIATITAGCAGIGALIMKPGLLPRLASKGFKIERRKQIWQTALLMIKDHGIFGGGPLYYYSAYEGYKDLYIATYGLKSFKEFKKGIAAPHAHTMFLEPFVSFGLIGTLMLGSYLFMQIKAAFMLFIKKTDISLAAFIFGSLFATIFFSILDFPLLWHQCAMACLLIVSSADIYKEENKKWQ